MKNSKLLNSIYSPIIFSILIVLGIGVGMLFDTESNTSSLSLNSKYKKLDMLLEYIDSNYVDSIDAGELVEKLIPDILTKLDPHSMYIPAKDLISVSESLNGNFEGIGVQFNVIKDTIVIINTISGGPSDKIGLLAGDRIIQINHQLVAGTHITNSEIIKKLKGKKGTSVIVSILRRNSKKLIHFKIIRDKVKTYSVDVAYMIDNKIGFIKIAEFTSTTYIEFKKAVNRLKRKGMEKLILDLRGNAGGYLDMAIKIADEFLPKDKLIVYTKGKSRPKVVSYATKRGICEETELVILIDEWSASASEIVVGAIQDNDRGIIIGRRSFGKGLVQEQSVLDDGSAIRLTIARYFTPTGRSIQKPYKDGNKNYSDDITNRYLHGEFQNIDSIKFPDSLRYTTPNGRVVYGGGGIMPDIFIPIDTLGWTPYLSKIMNKGIIYKFAFDYVDNNRARLIKYRDISELNTYLNKLHLLNQFMVFASKNGVKKNYPEILISQGIIDVQIKANIARNILGDKGYYPIIKDIDTPVIKSIEFLKEEN